MNLNPRLAVGTSSLAVLVTGIVGSVSYFSFETRIQSVDVLAAGILAITSVPMAFLFARNSYRLHPDIHQILIGILIFCSIPFVLAKLVKKYL